MIFISIFISASLDRSFLYALSISILSPVDRHNWNEQKLFCMYSIPSFFVKSVLEISTPSSSVISLLSKATSLGLAGVYFEGKGETR